MPSSTFLPTDEASGARITIDTERHELHLGNVFTFDSAVIGATAGSIFGVLIRTGNKRVRIEVERNVMGAIAKTEVYEGVTVVSVGSVINTINRNRNSSNVSIVKFYGAGSEVTLTAATLMSTAYILASATGSAGKSNSSFKDVIAWELKENTDYWAVTTFNAAADYYSIGAFTETPDGV